MRFFDFYLLFSGNSCGMLQRPLQGCGENTAKTRNKKKLRRVFGISKSAFRWDFCCKHDSAFHVSIAHFHSHLYRSTVLYWRCITGTKTNARTGRKSRMSRKKKWNKCKENHRNLPQTPIGLLLVFIFQNSKFQNSKTPKFQIPFSLSTLAKVTCIKYATKRAANNTTGVGTWPLGKG